MAQPLLMVAGEASGDQHGAQLLTALRTLRPEVEAWGLGGDEMRAAGQETVADAADISVVGIVEVLRIYRRAKQIFDLLLAEVERRGTRLAILVDFPGFNLRLAKALDARGVTVVYYISPQVWAWRRGRVKTIAKTVDRMLVLFPFEVEFYRRYGIEAIHVGHPLVDDVPTLPHVWDQLEPGVAPEAVVVALLPGSRGSEVRALLPTMLATAAEIARHRPTTIRLIRAATVPEAAFAGPLAAAAELDVEVVRRDRFTAIAGSHVALCASGTATLEVGLIGTPMVVLYRLSRGSYWLGRLLVRLPWFSLVNLVLGAKVVPELLQGDARPDRAAAEADALLRGDERCLAMRRTLAGLRKKLGSGGASARAAAAIVPLLPAVEEPAP